MSQSSALLDWARAVAAHPELGLEGAWPRAAALLGRQALEAGLDEFWKRQLSQMGKASRATQLACLEQFVRDPDLVSGIRTAWGALSRACHHHPYELAPTAHELQHWFSAVEGLLERLAVQEAAVDSVG